MDGSVCFACGAGNRRRAKKCKRCSARLGNQTTAPRSSHALGWEGRYKRHRRSINASAVFVALMVARFFGGMMPGTLPPSRAETYAAYPVPGPRSDTGFKMEAVDPETGKPIRFDPCTKQHFVINPDGAPRNAVADVKEAFRRLGDAMDMDYVYDGLTDEPFVRHRQLTSRPRYGERWSPILVMWADYDPSFFTDSDTYAIGGPMWALNRDRAYVYVGGVVVLNRWERHKSGFGRGIPWGRILLHELGHVAGLGHVRDRDQVMHWRATPGPSRYGEGDLAGLRLLGRDSGCIEQPDTRDPEAFR
ncbi:MAG: hypothetical protein ACRDKT_17185 [Actinomycetota bacterium]